MLSSDVNLLGSCSGLDSFITGEGVTDITEDDIAFGQLEKAIPLFSRSVIPAGI